MYQRIRRYSKEHQIQKNNLKNFIYQLNFDFNSDVILNEVAINLRPRCFVWYFVYCNDFLLSKTIKFIAMIFTLINMQQVIHRCHKNKSLF